jgi:hypothetical protein
MSTKGRAMPITPTKRKSFQWRRQSMEPRLKARKSARRMPCDRHAQLDQPHGTQLRHRVAHEEVRGAPHGGERGEPRQVLRPQTSVPMRACSMSSSFALRSTPPA